MSSLIDFDDGDDLFTPSAAEGQANAPKKSLDDIFGTTGESGGGGDTLDDIFSPVPSDDIFQPQQHKKKEESSNKMDNLFGEDVDEEIDFFSSANAKDTSVSVSSEKKPSSAMDDLDFLMQPEISQSDSGNKSHGVSHEDDSLDFLLQAQPLGTVLSSDDLLSLDPFSSPIQRSTTSKPSKALVEPSTPTGDLFGDDNDDVEDLLSSSVPNDKPTLAEDKTNTELHPIGGTIKANVDLPQTQSESKETSHDLEFIMQPTISQSDSRIELPDVTRDDSEDSLDTLLQAQPVGTVPSNDDLASLAQRVGTVPSNDDLASLATLTNNTSVSSNTGMGRGDGAKDSPVESPEPLEDVGAPFIPSSAPPGESLLQDEWDVTEADRQTEAETIEQERNYRKKAPLKKSMERSFEDLLTGLSDESEPELDDMIIHDGSENTNIESLLDSPVKSNRHTERNFGLNAASHDTYEESSGVTHTHKVEEYMEQAVDEDSDDGREGSPEVRVIPPQDEDLDIKSWQMVDDDGEDINDNATGDDDVVMRHPRNRGYSNDSEDGADLDLSVIEDTNHLDVDVNKHKSALGKKGSLALRRKPSRKSRRSLMSTGEDALFQDSTEPKPASMTNGDDEAFDTTADEDRYDMSPPAKKPSPSMMIPLPGMQGRPPSQRLSSSSAGDDDMEEAPREARRISKPPPGAFKLPSVMPRSDKLHHVDKSGPSHSEKDTKSAVFNKPPLKAVKPSSHRATDNEAKSGFDVPVLKSVKGEEPARKAESEERDVMFEKPALRSAGKPQRNGNVDDRLNTELAGTFEKPQLKSTPKIERRRPHDEDDSSPFDGKQLRSAGHTETPSRGNSVDSDQHVFEKPKLRSTPNKTNNDENRAVDNELNNGAKMFEKPVLRQAKRNVRTESESSDTAVHAFSKPALRNTPGKAEKDMNNKNEQLNAGMFDKPALRKATPSPEKEVKSFNEPKGTFDKPSLRRAEKSPEKEVKGVNDAKGVFDKPSLRKTRSPMDQTRERTPEKPAWLQAATNKQSKALDVLQTKENQNQNSPVDKPTPAWLDNNSLKKSSVPLQDSSNGQSDPSSPRKLYTPSRSRETSIGSENDPERRKNSVSEHKESHNNYTPSWMRQNRSPSVHNVTGMTSVTPAKSCPNLDSDEVPQWKKELASRRQNRKDSSPMDTPKKTETTEPEWKKNIALRKVQPTTSPAKEIHSVEPEWKKAAEEKRARLRNSTVPGQMTDQ